MEQVERKEIWRILDKEARQGNMSKASLYQVIAKASLDVCNVSKAHLNKIIIVETLYVTNNLTKNPCTCAECPRRA